MVKCPNCGCPIEDSPREIPRPKVEPQKPAAHLPWVTIPPYMPPILADF